MYIEDDDNYANRYECSVCLNELEKGHDVECGCGAEYDRRGQRVWPDDPEQDLRNQI